MGSPLSGLLADIFLNNFENTYLLSPHNKWQRNISFYKRYVDDTFVIFDGTTRQANMLLHYMNNINKNIQFTLEIESDNAINFLDLTFMKHNNKFQYRIYRKPTTTDGVIHADSFHPHSQKMAAFNSMIHRLYSVPLDPANHKEEVDIIKHIAIMNGYRSSLVEHLMLRHERRTNNPHRVTTNATYMAIDYTNNFSMLIRNTFKKHNIHIAFRTTNNIRKMLNNATRTSIEKRTGVYKMMCDDCNMHYIGQTGRTFFERYKEHLPTSISNINKSNYAKHLVSLNHNYTNFEANCKPLHICRKGRYMDAVEEFEIYRAFRNNPNNILNEQLAFKSHTPVSYTHLDVYKRQLFYYPIPLQCFVFCRASQCSKLLLEFFISDSAYLYKL